MSSKDIIFFPGARMFWIYSVVAIKLNQYLRIKVVIMFILLNY